MFNPGPTTMQEADALNQLLHRVAELEAGRSLLPVSPIRKVEHAQTHNLWLDVSALNLSLLAINRRSIRRTIHQTVIRRSSMGSAGGSQGSSVCLARRSIRTQHHHTHIRRGSAVAASSVVHCRIKNSGTQTISASSTQALTWDQEDYDPSAMHDTGVNTDRITFPIAGKYDCKINLKVDIGTTPPSVVSYFLLQPYLNGGGSAMSQGDQRIALKGAAVGTGANTYEIWLLVTFTYNFEVGDYIVWQLQNADTATTANVTNQTASAEKVG